jgi:hypothetical protein
MYDNVIPYGTEPRNRFSAELAGTITLFVVLARQAIKAGEIDSWSPDTFTNLDSEHVVNARHYWSCNKISRKLAQVYKIFSFLYIFIIS